MEKIKIVSIKKSSIADDIGIVKGEYLLSVNSNKIVDILDYKFNVSQEYVEVEIEHLDKSIEIFEIEKDEDEDLGLEFESELIDKPRSCANKCIFCFMEQLPKNCRDTLVFKDDDYRLSFFTGNYITMTNMSKKDVDRIVKYRVSPINISIHATDADVRCKMLNNKNAGKVMDYLEILKDANISVNTQIVLCKGINDGEVLEKTITQLSKFTPIMRSICIVPVGISKHREGLYPLLPLDSTDCALTIDIVSKYQKVFLNKFGTRIVYLADEIYLKAAVELPAYDEYEEFLQLENGVGMIAVFEDEFKQYLQTKINTIDKGISKNISIVTGKITYSYILEKIEEINKHFPNINVSVIPVENSYFGNNITVTGLMCGTDISTALKDSYVKTGGLSQYIVIPDVCLKDDEDIFLDDMKLVDLAKSQSSDILVCNTTAKGFLDSIVSLDSDIFKDDRICNQISKGIYKLKDNTTYNSYENSYKY